jgi:hypothetical protein
MYRMTVGGGLVLALGLATTACNDVMSAQSSDLAVIRSMLETVMVRLDSIDARALREHDSLTTELAALGTTVSNIAVGVGVGVNPTVGGQAQLEGSLCFQYGWQAAARFHSAITLRGRGDATVGVDGYGNGGTANIDAFGGQSIGVMPQGGASANLQVCAKLSGQAGINSAAAGAGPNMQVTDATKTLLQNLIASVGSDQLAAAASARNMSGPRAAQALSALTSLSTGDLPFGGAGAASLVGALPLPADMSALLSDPSKILDKAAAAGAYAVDRICDQKLFTGEFAGKLNDACNLRNQMPSGTTLIGILNGLDGLPATVGTLQSSMTQVCNTLGTMTPETLSIPAVTVTFPLGIGPIQTFPGYSRRLFPGLSAPSC